MFVDQQIEHPDRERDEAIKVLEAFAEGFADLTPEEIEQEVSRALTIRCPYPLAFRR